MKSKRVGAVRPKLAHLDASSGFTLVELVVVMVLTLLFSGLILTFFFDLWGSTATLMNDGDTFETRTDAGDALRDDFNASSGLINQNGIPDPNADNPDPAQPSGQYWIPIHAIPGTTTMPSSGTTPVLYYKAPSVDSSKNFILNGTQPYDDDYVLYLNAATKSLMLRTIANSSAAGNHAVTSCPPSSATTSCPADKTIATNVSSVGETYYSRSGNTINWESITDPITGNYIGPDFPSVEVLQLTLGLHVNSTLKGDTNTDNSTIIRVTFRNN
jgi:hypothetical protein